MGADLSGLAVPTIPLSDCYEHTMLGSLCTLLELDHQCPRRFQETWFLTDEANGTNALNSFPLENIYTWLPPWVGYSEVDDNFVRGEVTKIS